MIPVARAKPAVFMLMGGLLLAGCGFNNSAAGPHPAPTTKSGARMKSGMKRGARKVKRGMKQGAHTVKSGARHLVNRRGMGRRAAMGGVGWILASRHVRPMSLTTLPPLSYLKKLNPWLARSMEVSTFITGMGYHWATAYAGLVLMTNQANQVTAVEAAFPQKLGTFPWWDPPTTQPNSGVAWNSEHLYFVSSSSITPTMSTTATADLTSWSAFEGVNTRLSSYVKTGTLHGLTIYAPPNGEPGIQVLVAPSGTIAGFAAQEPAAWGHFPGYYPRWRRPLSSAFFGKAYESVLLLQPIPASGGTTTAGASRAGATGRHKGAGAPAGSGIKGGRSPMKGGRRAGHGPMPTHSRP
jgi:hypothetical protein